jgi:F0F1-type ATP synthase assembly protein I
VPRPRDPNNPRGRAAWFRYTDAASVGIEMVVAITVCALGALWLERNVTHWSPWTSILGMLVGIGAAAKAVLRAARMGRPQPGSEPAKTAPDDAARPRGVDPSARDDRPGDSG